ncbi:MAG: Omp28-related outer membrane protein [Alistipes sp.]|nr:Omp28-related outer membrane protein [Alistipes sp.]
MKIAKFFALLGAVAAFVACEPANNNDPEPPVNTTGSIKLQVNAAAVAIGDDIEFTVLQEGQDVTALSTIYMNGSNGIEALDGYTYRATVTGSYTFFATKDAETSAYITVVVMAEVPEFPADTDPTNTKFNHRVMILDHTGAGCGYCPLVTNALHYIETTDLKNNYNEVTCHGGGYASPTGDPGWSAAAEKIDAYTPGITGYPHVRVNFTNGNLKNYGAPKSFEAEVRSLFSRIIKKNGADVGIAMNVVGDAQNVYAAASIKAAVTNEYKVVAWLLENKIVNKGQANYEGPYDDFIYIYNHAVRQISGNYSSANVLGESIGTLEAGDTFNTAFQLPIVSTKWNTDNMEVIILVSAKNAQGKWDVVNTAVCPVGEQISFEYLQ